MVRTAAFLLAFGIGLIAAPITPAAAKEVDKYTQAATDTLADCLLRSDRRRLTAAIASDPTSGAFERATDGYSADCHLDAMKKHSVWLKLEGEALRYALAEAIFRQNLSNRSLNDLQLVAPLRHGIADYKPRNTGPVSKAQQERNRNYERSIVGYSLLSECVVRSDPERVRRLLAYPALSEGEAQAVQELLPNISMCVDKSLTLKLERQSIRGALAVSYVRLASAPRMAQAQPAGVAK